ncbi:hypothetical protein K2X92_05300 [Candidatus Gracilibacteria bacterium]|nr:hypothetical protein [Candidatus Gracilibacteria bacterium]
MVIIFILIFYANQIQLIIWLILSIVPALLITTIILSPLKKEIIELTNTIKIYKEIPRIQSSIQGYDEIETLIINIDKGYDNLYYLKYSILLKIISKFGNISKFDIQGFVDHNIREFQKVIFDFKNDLGVHINEQQKILESAKLEVENNIKGTPELEEVSELQKIRLDNQVKQFEELQRVLVKV